MLGEFVHIQNVYRALFQGLSTSGRISTHPEITPETYLQIRGRMSSGGVQPEYGHSRKRGGLLNCSSNSCWRSFFPTWMQTIYKIQERLSAARWAPSSLHKLQSPEELQLLHAELWKHEPLIRALRPVQWTQRSNILRLSSGGIDISGRLAHSSFFFSRCQRAAAFVMMKLGVYKRINSTGYGRKMWPLWGWEVSSVSWNLSDTSGSFSELTILGSLSFKCLHHFWIIRITYSSGCVWVAERDCGKCKPHAQQASGWKSKKLQLLFHI